MSFETLRSPEQPNQKELAIQKILQTWFEHTPIILCSSSEARRDGLIATGFAEKNIQQQPVPEEVEQDIFKQYGSANTTVVERSAEAKTNNVGFSSTANAIIIGIDTLVSHYQTTEENGILGFSEKKPANIENAKEETRLLYLKIFLNYLKLKSYEKNSQLAQDSIKAPTEKHILFLDIASAIHVKTSVSILFPRTEKEETYSDRIVAKPQLIYDLAENFQLGDIDFSNIKPTDLAEMKNSNGETVGGKIDEIVSKVYSIMEQNNTDPLKICAGVAYSLPEIREFLKIKELPDFFSDGFKSEKPDQNIYDGYPAELMKNILHKKAEQLVQ